MYDRIAWLLSGVGRYRRYRGHMVNISTIRFFLLVPVLTIVLWPSSVLAQDVEINFPDPELESAIREAIAKPHGSILESELLKIESLTVPGVSDLTGIKYCRNLTYLMLEDGGITDISNLSGLSKLTDLSLKNNKIEDVSSLSELADLTLLNIDGNQISNIDPLSGLIGLTWLAIADNNISDISPLSGLKELETLFAWGNRIEDISPLQDTTDLAWLNIAGNRIVDISPLKDLTNLYWLNIESNRISDVSALSELKELTWLAIADNNITDISPLSGLTELETLFAWGNRIENISPLQDLLDLTLLNLEKNRIEDISPLQDLIDLTWLTIADNNISDISALSGLTKLEILFVWGNLIEDISPLLELRRLKTVDLVNNPLGAKSCDRDIPVLVERLENVNHDCEPNPSLPWAWLIFGIVVVAGVFGALVLWVNKRLRSRVIQADFGNEIACNPVEVDESRREVLLGGRELRPQPKGNEYRFLSILSQNLGKVVSYEEIIEYVWQNVQNREGISRQDVNQLASRVRKALGKNTYGRYIKNVPGFGYMLDQEFGKKE